MLSLCWERGFYHIGSLYLSGITALRHTFMITLSLNSLVKRILISRRIQPSSETKSGGRCCLQGHNKFDPLHGKLYPSISYYHHENLRPGFFVVGFVIFRSRHRKPQEAACWSEGFEITDGFNRGTDCCVTTESDVWPSFCTVQVTITRSHAATSINCRIFTFGVAPMGLSERE